MQSKNNPTSTLFPVQSCPRSIGEGRSRVSRESATQSRRKVVSLLPVSSGEDATILSLVIRILRLRYNRYLADFRATPEGQAIFASKEGGKTDPHGLVMTGGQNWRGMSDAQKAVSSRSLYCLFVPRISSFVLPQTALLRSSEKGFCRMESQKGRPPLIYTIRKARAKRSIYFFQLRNSSVDHSNSLSVIFRRSLTFFLSLVPIPDSFLLMHFFLLFSSLLFVIHTELGGAAYYVSSTHAPQDIKSSFF